MTITAEEELKDGNRRALQYLLGISSTTVNTLVRENVFSQLPGTRGHYDLGDCVKAYIHYRTQDKTDGQRTAKTRQETRKLQLLNDEKEGKLVRIEDASRVWAEYCAAIRAGVTSLPGRLAAELGGMSKPIAIRELISGEVTQLLEASEAIFGEFQTEFEAMPATVRRVGSIEATPQQNDGGVGRRKPGPAKGKRRTRKVA